MKVLITTTINVPHVLTQWAEGLTTEDWIIVAGDLKSPHAEIRALLDGIMDQLEVNTLYLDPEHQMEYAMSEITGWNCIQRRNIALLEAIKLSPEFIITVDDDNYPTRGRDQLALLTQRFDPAEHVGTAMYVQSSTWWWNPGYFLQADDPQGSDAQVVHRGFPLTRRHEQPSWPIESRLVPDDVKIGVAAMLWTGDPDIDAIERMVNRPHVSHNTKDVILAPGTWAPFNSQATMFRAELAPLMMVWPGVGRYDDIWASYLARAVMDHFGYSVYYGSPVVHQDRNEHDLVKDLKDEMFGMEFNERIIAELRDVNLAEYATTMIKPTRTLSIREAMEFAQGYLMAGCAYFLPQKTKNAFHAWSRDLDNLGIK